MKRNCFVSSLCCIFRFWIDTADKQPCIGTGGMIPWTLKATGKLFHSGLAHKVFNLIILVLTTKKNNVHVAMPNLVFIEPIANAFF